jgi:hypothetical protein
VAQAEMFASAPEGEGFVARAVVGHYALDLDAEVLVVGECSSQEGGSAASLLIGHDLGKGNAGVVVNRDMDVLPSRTSAVALSPAVTRDAMADLVELAELFDVDVD